MVLGLIEISNLALNKHSLEMLTLGAQVAKALGEPLNGLVIGEPANEWLEQLQGFGLEKVFFVQDSRLDMYAPEAWARAVLHLITTSTPSVVMAPGTDRGNEVMGHVASELGLPLAVNCTSVVPGSPCQVVRVQWGGTVMEEATIEGDPVLLTSAPFLVVAVQDENPQPITVEQVAPSFRDSDFRVQVKRIETEQADRISLSDARVVVGGGRGVGSAEGFGILEKLASLLGGAVGGSRVATNNGWRPHTDQIGQTGTRISPDLYIACGISGASQHMVGCMGAKKILAVNTDREAPIFLKAEYGVVGNLHEVLAAIVSELEKSA